MEKNEAETNSYNNLYTSSQSAEEFPRIFKEKNSFSDWESEAKIPPSSRLPPRSIYFDHAHSNQYNRNLASPERPNRMYFTEHESKDRPSKICDNCLESSTTSSADEVNATFQKRTFSLSPQRFPLTSRLVLETNNKSNGHKDKILKSDKFVIQDLLLIKRIASIFIYFNGFKPSLRISATSFRNMARKCRLCESGALPAVDILFIDIMRQWQRQVNDHTTPYYDTFRVKNPITSHHTSGLPFQGFLEAIFRIAKSRFKGISLKEKLEALVYNCEQYIQEASRAANKISKKRKEKSSIKFSQIPPRISGVMSARQPYF